MKQISILQNIWAVITVAACCTVLYLQWQYASSNVIVFAAVVGGFMLAGVLAESEPRRKAEVTVAISMLILIIGAIVIPIVAFGVNQPTIGLSRRMWIEVAAMILVPFMGVSIGTTKGYY
jgi:hypothetical protein